mmetsp:Transcript_22283/g.44225  ORF Transcript_22283/g.44225 Transcript_22283/m.44225 type:complete len:219 (-) Transcript_22283:320-976(-)
MPAGLWPLERFGAQRYSFQARLQHSGGHFGCSSAGKGAQAGNVGLKRLTGCLGRCLNSFCRMPHSERLQQPHAYRQQRQRPSLVGGGQRDRDVVDESQDAQADLSPGHHQHAPTSQTGVLGQGGAVLGALREHRGQHCCCGQRQGTVVELHQRRVLEEVAPLGNQVRVHHILRHYGPPHQRELVVDQPSLVASHKGTTADGQCQQPRGNRCCRAQARR